MCFFALQSGKREKKAPIPHPELIPRWVFVASRSKYLPVSEV